MKTSPYFSLLILVMLCVACNTSTKKDIAKINDYNHYLELEKNETLQFAEAEYQFWNEKLIDNPNQFPYLLKKASSLSSLFQITGNIDYLIEAERDLVEANSRTHFKSAGYLRALARNYISQHRFQDALGLLNKAELNGEHLKATQYMLFDVHLELGNTKEAKNYLVDFQNFNDFDYIIRLAKWQDHEGNLTLAIKHMERALKMVESSNNAYLKQWVYTNIADFYGHDTQVKKSYMYYLKALALDPSDAYAKKGIAWIVYAHDNNPVEAMRILNRVTKHHKTPDYELLKAEIAEYMGDESSKNNYIDSYMEAVKNSKYGDMYNAYNTLLYTDELKLYDAALQLAKREVANRPTALSYDLLAWSYFKNGNLKEALKIIDSYVINKSFEPHVLYHIAEIYKENGRVEDAKKLKKELLGATYELGPVIAQHIQDI